ncbi:hypothetical protein [Albimonas pacifica]|uniref:Uncharacterized protein n=1 Tax=Albimonas pacifica TaxID=1114924 RepID=A0A1I3HKA4_9RHOB|nr:hypothetical protein [Albimonas pacifica]SFI36164.1 hypothetical protein SAMN05216258_10644 [Albimonas pacifica]
MTGFAFHAPKRIEHSPARLRHGLGVLLAYREAFAASRPADMPATDRAIARLRWALGEPGAAEPDERAHLRERQDEAEARS